MLQPSLEITGARLDGGARIETVFREPRERIRVEIVKHSEAMFPRRADVDVRAAGVAVLE